MNFNNSPPAIKILQKTFFLLFFGLGPLVSWAQSEYYAERDLIEKLAPASNSRSKTRGLRNLVVEDANQASDKADPKEVSLTTNFKYDSARIEKDSFHQLSVLASAMNSPTLQKYNFKIEGHTDATGTVEYNKKLSLKRAISVKSYLVGKGVNAVRLIPEGMGFEQLANSNDPASETNRRVIIKTILD